MQKVMAIMIAGLMLVGTALAFPNTSFPTWDNHSATQIDYVAWQNWANSAGNYKVPAFASSWANATAGVIDDSIYNQTPIIIDIASASTYAFTKNWRVDPQSITNSTTISIAGLGYKPYWMDNDENLTLPDQTLFKMDGLEIVSCVNEFSMASTSASADATGIWNSWAIAPSASAAFVNSKEGLSEAWSMSAAVSDWGYTDFDFNLQPFAPGPVGG